MAAYRKANLLISFRNLLCYSFLILAIISEAYSTLAIALDRFAPSWYRVLGWFLLTLPLALSAGLLLLYANRRRLAFYLSAASLLLYAALVFVDAYQAPAERGDWIFECAWVAFCALGVFAAKSLMSRPEAATPQIQTLFSGGSQHKSG
jgi:hypothetical protein